MLAADSERVLRLTAQADLDAEPGSQRNRVVATAADVAGVRAEAVRVRVAPLPDTACGSRLLRTLPTGAAPRC